MKTILCLNLEGGFAFLTYYLPQTTTCQTTYMKKYSFSSARRVKIDLKRIKSTCSNNFYGLFTFALESRELNFHYWYFFMASYYPWTKNNHKIAISWDELYAKSFRDTNFFDVKAFLVTTHISLIFLFLPISGEKLFPKWGWLMRWPWGITNQFLTLIGPRKKLAVRIFSVVKSIREEKNMWQGWKLDFPRVNFPSLGLFNRPGHTSFKGRL